MKLLEIWRYPVKSMAGEQLVQAHVGPEGVVGDRQRAVVDAATGVSLSAKRYPQLLACRAWTNGGAVMIGLPDGAELPAEAPDAADALSALLQREVALRHAADGQGVRHEFPSDLAAGAGEPFIWEPGLDGFFDRAPLHLITTATLARLGALQPASDFACARFRPNFLAEVDDSDFVEDAWVGKDVSLGEVRCQVLDRKPRCVMTTRAQGGLAQDLAVIKTIAKGNDGHAGIELRAHGSGSVSRGEPLRLLT